MLGRVPGSGGAIFISTFIIIALGVLLVVTRRLGEPWWRFVLYGAAVAELDAVIPTCKKAESEA